MDPPTQKDADVLVAVGGGRAVRSPSSKSVMSPSSSGAISILMSPSVPPLVDDPPSVGAFFRNAPGIGVIFRFDGADGNDVCSFSVGSAAFGEALGEYIALGRCNRISGGVSIVVVSCSLSPSLGFVGVLSLSVSARLSPGAKVWVGVCMPSFTTGVSGLLAVPSSAMAGRFSGIRVSEESGQFTGDEISLGTGRHGRAEVSSLSNLVSSLGGGVGAADLIGSPCRLKRSFSIPVSLVTPPYARQYIFMTASKAASLTGPSHS